MNTHKRLNPEARRAQAARRALCFARVPSHLDIQTRLRYRAILHKAHSIRLNPRLPGSLKNLMFSELARMLRGLAP